MKPVLLGFAVLGVQCGVSVFSKVYGYAFVHENGYLDRHEEILGLFDAVEVVSVGVSQRRKEKSGDWRLRIVDIVGGVGDGSAQMVTWADNLEFSRLTTPICIGSD